MYVDFDCGLDDYSLSDCNIPSGITTSISSCASGDVIGIQCASKHDASIRMNFNAIILIARCEEKEIRLVGGDSFGRVDVCHNGTWGSICSDVFWDDIDAGVVCQQLGYSKHGKVPLIMHI